MSNVLIPVDYWWGNRTLELEIPWLTPESIHMLELFCKPYHEVLEFGAGGSTLFFSRRVKSVLSFEGDDDWLHRVLSATVDRSLMNVDVRKATTIAGCHEIIGDRQFDIILVDCDGLNRWEVANLALAHVRKDGVILVDNYDAIYSRNLDVLFSGRLQTAYDDLHWVGKGTKVYYC